MEDLEDEWAVALNEEEGDGIEEKEDQEEEVEEEVEERERMELEELMRWTRHMGTNDV
jgi:hypothetical protein